MVEDPGAGHLGGDNIGGMNNRIELSNGIGA